MPSPLNLSPERGPSAWDRLERQSALERLGLFLLSGGAAASTIALTQRRGRNVILALGAACVVAGLLFRGTFTRRTTVSRTPADDAIDRASADSFPASDPPSIPAAATNL